MVDASKKQLPGGRRETSAGVSVSASGASDVAEIIKIIE